ncbi:DUF2249 domain-containing protein [Nitratifractor sp.]
MRRILLDARGMEHPEPLERAIAALRTLDGESYLYMLHRKEPIPLLALAREHGLNHLSRQDDRGRWHILITPVPDIDLAALVDPDLEPAPETHSTAEA